MKLTVLLFGPYADALNKTSVTLELPHQIALTTQALKTRLAVCHPELAAMLQVARVAVNQRLADPDQTIQEHDELAIVGMVGGG